jgi:hypothetical protein
VTAAPGGTYNITIREPALQLKFAGAPLATGTPVRVTPKSGDCLSATPVSHNVVNNSGWTDGFPYGVYDVCATWKIAGINFKLLKTGVSNTNPNGTTVDIPTAVGPASCP